MAKIKIIFMYKQQTCKFYIIGTYNIYYMLQYIFLHFFDVNKLYTTPVCCEQNVLSLKYWYTNLIIINIKPFF